MSAVVFDPGKPFAGVAYPWKALTFPLRAWPLAPTIFRVRTGDFDLVHVHYATHALVGPMSRTPFVVHCHGSDVRGVTPNSVAGRYLKAMLSRAGSVVYATPDLADAVRSMRADAVFVPNPIDSDTFGPGRLPERDVLLGVRLDPIKGAEVAIEATARLVAMRPSTSVTVVANGPLLQRAMDMLGGTRVELLERVAHDRMPALFRRHRTALGQFRVGAIGQYELEAMACGVPVVADFRHGGAYPEPPPIAVAFDAEAAANALRTLLEDEPLRAACAIRSRAWVVRYHDAVSVAARVRQVYDDVLLAAGRPPR